jgi:cytochrome c oxidase subunit 2
MGASAMNWLRSIMMPAAGSSYAAQIDDLYMLIFGICLFFFLLIAALLSYFVWRYRRRRPDEITPHISHNFKLELVWSIIPLVIVVILFFLGFNSYMSARVGPGEALEIQVTAKKWIWQFEYPDGMRALNDIYLPVNKPVRFVMSSEDVIHSFFVPSFRVKMDVLPNRYTDLWFHPLEEGEHTLLCAEYCGRGHSDMMAKIHVVSEEKFRRWQEEGDETTRSMPLAELGKLLYESRGCATCHSLDGSRREGPSFRGIFGETHAMRDGTRVLVDENYIRQSILEPQARIRAGFEGIMPTYQGLLREREITALVEFIKAQK